MSAHASWYRSLRLLRDQVESMVVSLFCTSEHGVLIQDSFSTPDQYSTYIGIEVPYHYFIRKVRPSSMFFADAANFIL